MRLAVISGYIPASAFALCGLLNTTQFCLYGGAENAGQFLNGFVASAWPLAVASVIMLLVQILCQVKQLCHATATDTFLNHRHPAKTVTKQNQNNTVSRHKPDCYFPVRETAFPQEAAESQVSPNEGEAAPESAKKLQFFKLH